MEKVAKVQENTKSVKDDAAFKAKKAEAAKKFAANQKAKKENLIKFSKELVDTGVVDKLSPEAKAFFTAAANPTVNRSGFGGQSFLNKVFGDSPKVGDSITVLDYMKKTLQAKGKLDKAVKDWAEKGIIVEFTEKQNKLESVYTIKKM